MSDELLHKLLATVMRIETKIEDVLSDHEVRLSVLETNYDTPDSWK